MAQTPAERQKGYRDRKRERDLAAVTAPDAASPAEPGLGPAGRRLWDDVTAGWDLQEHERALLTEACRARDRLDRLHAALDGAPLTVTSARGDQVSNPLLIEARQQAIVFARLCAALGLPSGDDAQPQPRDARRTHRGTRGFYTIGTGA